MDFSEKVKELGSRITELVPHITNEEATKNSLVLPFLQLLGYDAFDPRVVVPEYTSDVGTKKKEKVDLAVMMDGKPIMLMEVKCCGTTLDQGKATQLHRYFQNTPSARLAILTDGVRYEFFSDLDQPNLMDPKPFMIFNFSKIEDTLIPELRKLTMDRFDTDNALDAAQRLKYTREVQRQITSEFNNPSDDFVRLFASRVYSGRLMPAVLEEFRDRVKQAFDDFVEARFMERVLSPRDKSGAIEKLGPEAADNEDQEQDSGSRIVTTEEELEGYHIVRAILRQDIPVDRVAIRDKLSYCGILLDDNNRKPICRLHFNTAQKYLELFSPDGDKGKQPIDSVDDIYKYADALRETVGTYDNRGNGKQIDTGIEPVEL